HLTWLDARDREGGDVRTGRGPNRAPHVAERTDAEFVGLQSAMGCAGIADRERCEMHTGITRDGIVELATERCVCGLVHRLHIAALKHRGHIAGPGWGLTTVRIRIDLHRRRRRSESQPSKGAAGGRLIAHEMPDMVEEGLSPKWQLAVTVGRCRGC